MKKFVIALITFFVCPFVYGQTKNITLNYDVSDYIFETENGMTYIDSDVYDIFFESDTLLPALPIITINVLIGEYDNYVSHSATCTESLAQTNILMAPNDVDLSGDDVYAEPATPQYGNAIYPLTYVEYISTNLMDGAKFLTFEVHPFKYDASTGNLYLRNIVQFQINLHTTLTRASLDTLSGKLDNMRDAVKELVINNEEVDLLYPPVGNRSFDAGSDYDNNYVIVTNQSMKSQYQRLADWKMQKGIKTKVVTIEEINAKYPTISDTALKIKKELKNYYNGTYKGLKYALLGGDFNILPSPMCYIKFLTKYVDNTPSDWFFACFDTMNWDQNGNGVAGELSDNVDIYPEIIVTRLPSSNSQDAQMLVDRIIEYESDPNTSSWNNRILMGGARLHRSWGGKSDAYHKGEKIYSKYIHPYWNGVKNKFYDSGIDAPEVTNGIFSSVNLQNAFQGGYPFVFFDTHGNKIQWRITDDDKYNCYDAANLVNPSYTFINTSACKTNAFDQSSCLSKSFILNPNGNIMGYWGSSRLSFSKWLKGKIGQTNSYHAEFYKRLFTSAEKHYGELIALAKINHLGKCHTHMRAYRWLLFAMNALGDPEMPIFVDTPQTFNNVSISYNNGMLLVIPGISNPCQICVMSTADNGLSYYSVKKTLFPNIHKTFWDVYQTCSVCITSPGYIPYIATIEVNGGIAYIQNQTFTESQTINADSVFVGSNVTISKPQGPVSVDNGTLRINYQDKVIIYDSFKVKSGAQLKIQR